MNISTQEQTPPSVTQEQSLISGVFEDRFRLGETLTILVNEPVVHGELLTYGKPDPASPGPGNNGMRWFFFQDNWCPVNNYAAGFLFEGRGMNYPEGIENVQDPFGRIVGQQNPIGIYRLWRSDGGYLFQVNPYGEDAVAVDSLYTRDFHMNTLKFAPSS